MFCKVWFPQNVAHCAFGMPRNPRMACRLCPWVGLGREAGIFSVEIPMI